MTHMKKKNQKNYESINGWSEVAVVKQLQLTDKKIK